MVNKATKIRAKLKFGLKIKAMKKVLGVLLATGVVTLMSCRGKEKPTTAIVTVVDASENVVVGAEVRLYVANASNQVRDGVDKTETTNSSGVATFRYDELYELGQAGFAVLDIDVNNGQATGIIKIEEESDNEQTVICQTC